MILKDINQITESDLMDLVTNATDERKDNEYKQELFLNTEKEKVEFLADVSSFANSNGGDLYIGIKEDKNTNKPIARPGISIENTDQEKLKIENLLRDGIQPRIIYKDIAWIPLSNGNKVLIIRIYQSDTSPHRVILAKDYRFFIRHTGGRHALDVDELRVAFTLSENLKDKINNFIDERIYKIISDDTPVVCHKNPKILLHLVPLSSFRRPHTYDFRKINEVPHEYDSLLSPIGHSFSNTRFNYDGYLVFSGDYSSAGSYSQLFRNGALEVVEAFALEPHEGKKNFPVAYIENELIKATGRYLGLFKKMNVPFPIILKLSFLGVKGYKFIFENGIPEFYRKPIDKDLLQLPPQIVENYSVNAEAILRPCFDTLWGAGGFPCDLFYDKDGKWKPTERIFP